MDKQIAEGDVPELTAANFEATFGQLFGTRGDMFERGVLECFRRLSRNYKTNEPFKFDRRIIVKDLLSQGSTNLRITDELDDLMRVFRALDGKPEANHRHGAYYLVSGARPGRRTEAENDYEHLRRFQNDNGHLTFRRPDLVRKTNLILAKHYPTALAWEAP